MADERTQGGAGPLADLLAYMASQKPGQAQTAGQGRAASHDAAPGKGLAEPAQLDYFRELWAGVNTRRQLRQSQEQVPDNAGPLNSSHLVHRSLSLMRGLSPGYLRHFLAHVEALSWMEQLTGGSETGKDAPRTGSARKGARGR